MITTLAVGTAQASDLPNDADAVEQSVAAVAPTAVLEPTVLADGSFAAEGEHEAVLPANGDGVITLDGVGIGLPGADNAGEVAVNGSVIYEGRGDVADLAVQDLGDSVRVQSVFTESDAASFEYPIEGATPVILADGGVDLVVDDPSDPRLTNIVATFDAPWAVDAAGSALETHYEVSAGVVTQVVETTVDTVYPVVADPRISGGVGVYVSMNRTEIRAAAIVASEIAAVSAAAGCAYIAKLNLGRLLPFVNSACGSLGIGGLISIFKVLPSTSTSYYTAMCYQVRVPPQTPAWKVVDSSQCVSLADSFTW
ncbi:MAG: hypothetical protein HGA44_10815 [Cellulomonadaceae bacterium]|nr:hypothetical protein [Cellulomonadaceae bacterium]